MSGRHKFGAHTHDMEGPLLDDENRKGGALAESELRYNGGGGRQSETRSWSQNIADFFMGGLRRLGDALCFLVQCPISFIGSIAESASTPGPMNMGPPDDSDEEEGDDPITWPEGTNIIENAKAEQEALANAIAAKEKKLQPDKLRALQYIDTLKKSSLVARKNLSRTKVGRSDLHKKKDRNKAPRGQAPRNTTVREIPLDWFANKGLFHLHGREQGKKIISNGEELNNKKYLAGQVVIWDNTTWTVRGKPNPTPGNG